MNLYNVGDGVELLTPDLMAGLTGTVESFFRDDLSSTEVWRYNIILDESFQTQYNGLLKDVQRSEAEIKKLN
jgi:hypothetical protein